jgi:hypothetical protein
LIEICPANDEAICEPFLSGTKLLINRDEGAIFTQRVTLQRPQVNGLSESGRDSCSQHSAESIH